MFRLNTALTQSDALATRLYNALPLRKAVPVATGVNLRVTETCVPLRRNRKRRAATYSSPEAVRTTWF